MVAIVVLVYPDVHAIGVQQKYAMGAGTAVLKVDGM
jgi:hypothetical protein